MIPADPLRNLGPATILRADARALPLADDSVDLIVTSPPYFALRSYQDAGEHYDGQLGSEPTPAAFVAALIDCTREMVRVLKPSGSIFINLGDSYSRGQRLDTEFTAHDAAWLAGVIDSDGSVSIRVDNAGRSHVAWTRVGQMRREVVERIGKVTGTGKVWQDGRGVWNWNAAAQQARWVLERIWPWLHIKQRQALAAIDLMTQKAEGKRCGRWNPLTDEDLRRREVIRQAVLAWNRGEEFPDYEPPVVELPRLPGKPAWVPTKSLMGIPWRYALRCIDDLGLILRAEQIWPKPNGLPESVTDRTRRSHEQWFHFTLRPRYYSAVDEIREATTDYRGTSWSARKAAGMPIRAGEQTTQTMGTVLAANPLGKLPGSVWTIPTEPLNVPDRIAHKLCCDGDKQAGCDKGVDHFAAFPSEWPRRIIVGWSPPGVCTACGEGRRPVADSRYLSGTDRPGIETPETGRHRTHKRMGDGIVVNITGYACGCPTPTAPTTPAIVVDPFGGTGTVAMVARALGRHGIHADLSADYNRTIARWRITDLDQLAHVQGHKRTGRASDDAVPTLLDAITEGVG